MSYWKRIAKFLKWRFKDITTEEKPKKNLKKKLKKQEKPGKKERKNETKYHESRSQTLMIFELQSRSELSKEKGGKSTGHPVHMF